MNILELRLIIENVKKFGGFREKEILEHLTSIELIQNDDEHKVYKFSTNKNYFEYDFKSHLIVG